MNNHDESSDDKPIVVEDDSKSLVHKDTNGH